MEEGQEDSKNQVSMVVHALNPSTQDSEVDRSLWSDHVYNEFQTRQ